MRRIWVGLALVAAAAVVGIYLAGSDSRERATVASRPPAVPDQPEASAPEPPPDPEAQRVALLVVRDKAGNPVANATAGLWTEGKFAGDPVTTEADGHSRLPLPEGEWFEIAVRHPDFVQGQAWVNAGPKEQEIVLDRGAPLTVVVLDPARKPLAGAKVNAGFSRTHGASGFWQWTSWTELGESTTDAEGRAAVGAVPALPVSVAVDREPFALHRSNVEVVSEIPVEHVVVLDAGAVLVGRVIAPGGEGVPGATVKCQELARPVATSGPDGAFRLEGVAAGSVPLRRGVTLVAEAEGFGPGFFGAALGWGEPVPIPVRSGAMLDGLEIVLSMPSFIVGRIVDDALKPVEGVTVQAFVQRGFSLREDVKSDTEGRFRVGPFNVRERAQVWVWFSAANHAIERADAHAEPGRDTDLGDIKATRRAIIRGILVDTSGSPVKGQVSTDSRFTSSQPDGTFELVGVGPGAVTLTAADDDVLKAEVPGGEPTGPGLKSRPLVIETAAGGTVEGVEIVLLPTKPIRGRVITPDGKPRPNAIVGIKASGDPAAPILDRRFSGDQGQFGFLHLADGEYEVGLLGTATYMWSGGKDEGFLDEPASVTVSAGREDLEFVFPLKGGIITGKVVAKRDGLPLKEFDASFLRYKLFIPSDPESDSCKDGEFRYETDQPGTWQVDVSADGLASHRTDRFSLAAGEVKDLGTIRLGPGGTIAGTVLDSQQRPVPYARINILNEKFQTNDDEPYTDLEGRFEVKGVSPGPFTVFAVSPRHPLGMVRGVEVREGERTDVQVVFVEPAPLTIDVRDPSGQPVEGAALDFSFPAVAPLTSKFFRGKIPPGYGSHKSDAAGTILQPCLPPGEVTIMIEAEGFEPVTKKLELKPGEPNRVEIRLSRMGG